MSANKCSRCNKVALVVDPVTGEEACSACGLVVQERPESASAGYYRNSDRRSFEGEEDLRHHGPLATLLHFEVPVISTGSLDYDAAGAPVTAESKRLKAISFHVPRTAKQSETMLRGLNWIRVLGEKLALPKATQERAAFIFRHAVPSRKGARSVPLAAASVYLACKEHSVDRSLEVICKELDVPTGGAFKVATALKIAPDSRIKTVIEDPARHVRSWAVDLRLPEPVLLRALQLLDLPLFKVTCKAPKIRAAGVLWFAIMEAWPARADRKVHVPLSQAEVAGLAGCTEVSVRLCANEIAQALIAEKSGRAST